MGLFAAQLVGKDEVLYDASQAAWVMVRREPGTPANPTGRVATCELDITKDTLRRGI